MIVFSDLEAGDVEATVAAQAEHFKRLGEDVEWKLYAHDGPETLRRALAAHGFEADEPETVMLLELGSAAFSSTSTPADVEVRTVRTPADLAVYLAVTARAFGKEPQSSADDLALRLFGNAPETVAMIAFAGGRTVAAGRLELPRERAFASLWGGGTDPELRGRGIYRRLVEARAEIARARGYPYLTVDARETSRPILERLGFRALTTVTAWNLRAARSRGPITE
jgi:ribosomal protein S18 acetylase RimI-like enzyme